MKTTQTEVNFEELGRLAQFGGSDTADVDGRSLAITAITKLVSKASLNFCSFATSALGCNRTTGWGNCNN